MSATGMIGVEPEADHQVRVIITNGFAQTEVTQTLNASIIGMAGPLSAGRCRPSGFALDPSRSGPGGLEAFAPELSWLAAPRPRRIRAPAAGGVRGGRSPARTRAVPASDGGTRDEAGMSGEQRSRPGTSA